jgi:hypothetical protein
LELRAVARVTEGFVILVEEYQLLLAKLADYFNGLIDLGHVCRELVKKPQAGAKEEEKASYNESVARKKMLINFLDETAKTDISSILIRTFFPSNSHLAFRTFRDGEKSKLTYFSKRHEVLFGELSILQQ